MQYDARPALELYSQSMAVAQDPLRIHCSKQTEIYIDSDFLIIIIISSRGLVEKYQHHSIKNLKNDLKLFKESNALLYEIRYVSRLIRSKIAEKIYTITSVKHLAMIFLSLKIFGVILNAFYKRNLPFFHCSQ